MDLPYIICPSCGKCIINETIAYQKAASGFDDPDVLPAFQDLMRTDIDLSKFLDEMSVRRECCRSRIIGFRPSR